MIIEREFQYSIVNYFIRQQQFWNLGEAAYLATLVPMSGSYSRTYVLPLAPL